MNYDGVLPIKKVRLSHESGKLELDFVKLHLVQPLNEQDAEPSSA